MNLAKIYTFKISVISNISIEMYSYLQYFRFHHMLHVNTIIIPPTQPTKLLAWWYTGFSMSVCPSVCWKISFSTITVLPLKYNDDTSHISFPCPNEDLLWFSNQEVKGQDQIWIFQTFIISAW